MDIWYSNQYVRAVGPRPGSPARGRSSGNTARTTTDPWAGPEPGPAPLFSGRSSASQEVTMLCFQNNTSTTEENIKSLGDTAAASQLYNERHRPNPNEQDSGRPRHCLSTR